MRKRKRVLGGGSFPPAVKHGAKNYREDLAFTTFSTVLYYSHSSCISIIFGLW